MTHTALSATGALRRAAECVLMAFGVPVTRDMPVDAVFLPVATTHSELAWQDSAAFAANPATGAAMLDGTYDVLGCPHGEATPEYEDLEATWINDFDK